MLEKYHTMILKLYDKKDLCPKITLNRLTK